MKNWFIEFVGDMRHIWREFRREIADANADKSHYDDGMTGPEHSVDWNNVPDLDPRKPVNNLDNFYTREIRGTDNPGTRYQHRH